MLNFDNRLELPRYSLVSDFRPDFAFSHSWLNLQIKPRLNLTWDRCEDGLCDGEEKTDKDSYVNEWLIRIEPLDSLFFSYGRENLQWGPSFLLSPSNPFYTSNGRNNPKMEVPGADYGRVVWAPNMRWTGSFIVNTDEGRQVTIEGRRIPFDEEFNKTYALKFDYTADKGYFSLILSKRESMDDQVGFFASWNINDAIVVYTEENFLDANLEALIGGSYTFENGAILNAEYFHNGSGESDGNIIELLLAGKGPDSRLMLSYKNYLLLQYYYRDMFDRWNILFRGTINLDDSSAIVLSQFEYNLGDNVQLFANGTLYEGSDTDEFGVLLEYRGMVGLEFTY